MTNVEATADAEDAQELVVVVVAELRQARIAENSNLSNTFARQDEAAAKAVYERSYICMERECRCLGFSLTSFQRHLLSPAKQYCI